MNKVLIIQNNIKFIIEEIEDKSKEYDSLIGIVEKKIDEWNLLLSELNDASENIGNIYDREILTDEVIDLMHNKIQDELEYHQVNQQKFNNVKNELSTLKKMLVKQSFELTMGQMFNKNNIEKLVNHDVYDDQTRLREIKQLIYTIDAYKELSK